MIDIELNDEWVIQSDKYQFILGKKQKTENGYTLRDRTYHETIDGALKDFFNKEIRTTETNINTFEKLIELRKAQQKELEKIRKEMELE